MQIDLSAIAQGSSLDVIASELENQGIQNDLIEVGEELKVTGRKTNGTP